MRPKRIDQVEHVACVGAGTIGSGWAAYFLARGFSVTVSDPEPAARDAAVDAVARAWPSLERLGLAASADRRRLRVVPELEEAVRGADFVQENVPESADLKVAVISEIDRLVAADVVIASSTSGFPTSELAVGCIHPARCIVGHPFTPSYLIPLVEVSGSERTAAEVVDWTMEFYRSIGKFPLLVRKEIQGFVVNRMQNALLDEANRLVDAGVCSYADIDAAIEQGVGLRWAFMGLAMAVHLTGGRGGYRHAFHQFPWRGGQVSRDSLAQALEERVGNLPMRAIEEWRDNNIVNVMQARKSLPRFEEDQTR